MLQVFTSLLGVCCDYDLHLDRSVMDFSILIEVLWYCMCLFLY